jgi:GT2 family glycosyltransferase
VNVVSLSVVVVNWNSGALLERCLEALAKQTLRPDLVLVVDNGSTDQSADCVGRFPSFSLVRAGQNLGFAAGNNLAFRLCNTDLVALLNPDAFPAETWLEWLVAAAKVYPGCASFGSRQLSADDPRIVDGIGDFYHLTGRVWRERHGRVQGPEDLVPREIFSPCAAAALYRRKAVEAVGGFDEDYFCYVEDVDLGFRLRLAGYSARYVPEAVVLHCGSAVTGGRHSDFSIYHGHRNLVWTFVKNMPAPLFWTLLPGHILLNLATLVALTLGGRGKVIWKAKWDAVKRLRIMWGRRRAIQRGRVAKITQIWSAISKGVFPR